MLINVSTRRFGRAVRLPEGDVPAPPGSGGSKSAASRRFVALSAARLADFMAADLSALDLLVGQIDGLHLGDDLVLVAAIGVDGEGNKYPLAPTENAQRFKLCWTTWSRAGSTRRRQDCSSPTARKRCRRRFTAPSVRPLRSSAARSTRRAAWNAAERASCGHPSGAAPGLGVDDADKAGQDPQSRASTRPAPRRNPDCRPVEAAEGASLIPRL